MKNKTWVLKMNYNTSGPTIYFWNHIKKSDTNNYRDSSTHREGILSGESKILNEVELSTVSIQQEVLIGCNSILVLYNIIENRVLIIQLELS